MQRREFKDKFEEFEKSEDISDEVYKATFFCAIKPAIYVAKILGLFPIDISSKQPHEIKFKWINYRTIISFVFIFYSMFSAVTTLKTAADEGPLTASNTVGVIFFGICFTIVVAFFKIAMRFRHLMMAWVAVEKHLLQDKYAFSPSRWSLRRKISVFTFCFLCCSFSEHFFYLAAETYKLSFEIRYCNLTDYDPFELFVKRHLDFVLNHIPLEYNNFLGMGVEIMNFSCTFFWNYMDLFIMLLSIGLTDLLQRVSHRMECIRTFRISEDVWAEIRMDHVRVSELIKTINEEFGFIFMLACLNDSYFILIQMLNITTSLPFILSIIYFWYSLLYLTIRSTLMVTYASDVYENARKPLEVIRAVPTEQWCTELERFFNQIKFHSNALSGKNFFIITKTLLFSMAGVLVTYELVLLQVDGKTVEWQDLIDCK